MKRSDIKIMPVYFDRYINLIEDIELKEALEKSGANILEENKRELIETGDKVYAEGKWTVKEIIQHLIDSERVFSYRALRFARNDKTELPGYDENVFVMESKAGERDIYDMLSEYDLLRKSTVCLFDSFDETMLGRTGVCFDKEISVLALGFTMAGHTLHHTNVIREKYFSL